MAKPYLSKSGGAKKRNHYKSSGNGSAEGAIPAHTPSHLKKYNLKKVKYSS